MKYLEALFRYFPSPENIYQALQKYLKSFYFFQQVFRPLGTYTNGYEYYVKLYQYIWTLCKASENFPDLGNIQKRTINIL